MFGKNIPIKPVYVPTGRLNVVKIFRTIQGEGPYSGVPAVFIRLAGCNLKCFFCDTDFETGAEEKTQGQIFEEVKFLAGKSIVLVVITGGEPMAQPITGLCRDLAAEGLQVQIETAGTVWQDGMEQLCASEQVTLVCSPKTASVHAAVAKWCEHFKYVVRQEELDPHDGLPAYSTQEEGRRLKLYRALPRGNTVTWLTPCDEYEYEDNSVVPNLTHDVNAVKRNIDAAVSSALAHGYRVNFQLHKVLGVE